MELTENLKKILGEQFKEEMTAEEVLEAIGSKPIADLSLGEYVSKNTYNDDLRKANAKTDDYKKKLNEKLTDEEKQKAALEERDRQFEEQARENRHLRSANVFAQAGWKEEDYKLLVEKDVTEEAARDIVAVIAAREKANNEKIEELKLKQFKDPQGGSGSFEGKKYSELSLDEKMELAEKDPQQLEKLKNKKE